nr:N-acetylglucosamine-6-phosphate deacetylase [Crateriforma spongiae]
MMQKRQTQNEGDDLAPDDSSPGYVDLQVNGFAGVDFNGHETTTDDIHRACRCIRDDGAEKFCPTVITDDLDRMTSRIQTLVRAIDEDAATADLIAGIHVEGPFINPADGFVGAHPADQVRAANIDDAKRLIDAGAGHVRLFTLAPEQDADGSATRFLADQNIIVAAGHSDASLDDLHRALDHGLSLFTHLGNGCPASLPRHDNIISRVLSVSDRLAVSWIADGHHVPFFALQNYFRVCNDDQIIIVSDAISAASLGPGRHRLGDQWVHVDDDGAAWSADRKHFAGSATSLATMVSLMQHNLRCTDVQLSAWTRTNPLRLLGMT